MKRRALVSFFLAALVAVMPVQAQEQHLDPVVVEKLAPKKSLLDSIKHLHPFSFRPPLFKLPMARIALTPETAAKLSALPGELETLARNMLISGAKPGGDGYDWLFPQVYSHVTREILAMIDGGQLVRPDLMRVEIAQFYEVYARNLAAWKHGKAEPAWRRAANLSQRLAAIDIKAGRVRHDRMTFAGVVLMQSMYAHITVDLPRVLMMIFHSQHPRTPAERAALLAEMKKDFYTLTPAFDRSVSEVLSDQWVSWEYADDLPPFVRTLVERYGAGPAVRIMRLWAFERFEYNLKRNTHVAELLGLPTAPDVTHFVVPSVSLSVAN